MERSTRVFGMETEYGIYQLMKGKPKGKRFAWSAELSSELLNEFYQLIPGAVVEANRYWLVSGGCLYEDTNNHPEYATFESIYPEEVVKNRVGGDQLLLAILNEVNKQGKKELFLSRSNVGRKSGQRVYDPTHYNTFGTHVNISFDASDCSTSDEIAAKIRRIAAYMAPFSASAMTTWDGSGWLRCTKDGKPYFVLSQRLPFILQIVSSETTTNRALGNTRFETHTSDKRYSRWHSIAGDSHRSESIDLLRLKVMGLLMGIAELSGKQPPITFASREAFLSSRSLANSDFSMKKKVWKMRGGKFSSLDIQYVYLAEARKYYEGNAEACEILDEWAYVLEQLTLNSWLLKTSIEWQIKCELFRTQAMRMKLHNWNDARRKQVLQLMMLEELYSLINGIPVYEKLVERGRVERIFKDRDIQATLVRASAETRGYDRGGFVSHIRSNERLRVQHIDWGSGSFSRLGQPGERTVIFSGYPEPSRRPMKRQMSVDKFIAKY